MCDHDHADRDDDHEEEEAPPVSRFWGGTVKPGHPLRLSLERTGACTTQRRT